MDELRDDPGKKNGKKNDIVQKGGRGLHQNHSLKHSRRNDKSRGRGGLWAVVILFYFCVKCDIYTPFFNKLHVKLSIFIPFLFFP